MDSLDPAPSVTVQDASQARERRPVSEKQLEALQRGRERRWAQLHGDTPPPEAPVLKRTFAMDAKAEEERDAVYAQEDSSTDSEGWATPPPQERKLPKALRRRLDKYIQEKMEAVFADFQSPSEDPEPEEQYYDEAPERNEIVNRMTPATDYVPSVPHLEYPYRFM